MSDNYMHIADLAKAVEPPEDGILTRTLFNDDNVKAVIFGFGQGVHRQKSDCGEKADVHWN